MRGSGEASESFARGDRTKHLVDQSVRHTTLELDARLLAEVRRVLKAGATFAVYDVMRIGEGDISVTAVQPLRTDERVSLSVRPEDVDLVEVKPEGENVWEARVDQKVFLGEAVDFQVKVGPRTLLSRRHPTLRTKVGESIFVQLHPEKCVVLTVA